MGDFRSSSLLLCFKINESFTATFIRYEDSKGYLRSIRLNGRYLVKEEIIIDSQTMATLPRTLKCGDIVTFKANTMFENIEFAEITEESLKKR